MKTFKLKNLILGLFFIIPVLGIFTIPVKAQLTTCDFLPCSAVPEENSDATEADAKVESLFEFIAGLLFIVLIGYGILKIIFAAIKIIRSEADASKYEEGANTLKGVWIGIGMLFIGIIGLVIVTVIIGAEGIFSVEVENPEGLDVPIVTKD